MIQSGGVNDKAASSSTLGQRVAEYLNSKIKGNLLILCRFFAANVIIGKEKSPVTPVGRYQRHFVPQVRSTKGGHFGTEFCDVRKFTL